MDPFTNEPYNFNDTKVADPREAEFNNGIREITVSLHYFLIKFRTKPDLFKKNLLVTHVDEETFFLKN